MSTLLLKQSRDYRGDFMFGVIDTIAFAGTDFIRATFSASQMDGYPISKNVHLIGDQHRNFIEVELGNQTSFSAAGWTFANWFAPSPSSNDEVTIRGSEGNDTITGSSQADGLIGNGGNDSLVGGLGPDQLIGLDGKDILIGGAGDDHYRLDDVFYDPPVITEGRTTSGASASAFPGGGFTPSYYRPDTIVEEADGGIDSVLVLRLANFTEYTLPTNVEVGFIRTPESFTLRGNSSDNKLIGNQAADALFGFTGEDTLLGGNGTDLLDGGDGEDLLDGGARGDNMIGGNANDTYMVDDVGDVVTEQSVAGSGKDTVRTVITHTLADNVEVGVLLGTQAINLTGNNSANTLSGNAAANTLNGDAADDFLAAGSGNDKLIGARGADTMNGGSGSDQFIYSTIAEAGDTVEDFSSLASNNNDIFRFRGSSFGGLAPGDIAADQFEANTSGAATQGTTRFIYETDTQILRFDSNGSAAGGVTLIATLQPGATMTIDDINIF